MKNVDKGFELIYFNLSHRRKFIRTIWITIVGVLILLPLMFFKPKICTIFSFFLSCIFLNGSSYTDYRSDSGSVRI